MLGYAGHDLIVLRLRWWRLQYIMSIDDSFSLSSSSIESIELCNHISHLLIECLLSQCRAAVLKNCPVVVCLQSAASKVIFLVWSSSWKTSLVGKLMPGRYCTLDLLSMSTYERELMQLLWREDTAAFFRGYEELGIFDERVMGGSWKGPTSGSFLL